MTMRPLGEAIRQRISVALLLACCYLPWSSAIGWADPQGRSYAFDKLVVFDYVVVDKVTYQSQRVINVVALDDGRALRVIGKVAMPGHPAYVAAYAHDKDRLIALLWDRVDIYDLADPTKPRFVRSLDLGDQGFASPGAGLIEKLGDEAFALLNTRGTTELSLAGDSANWRVAPLPPPTPAQKSRMAAGGSGFSAPTPTPLPVYESRKFHYEIAWTDTHRLAEITHRQYLRKVDKARGRLVSKLLLSTQVETID
jgi:hypothetical protein